MYLRKNFFIAATVVSALSVLGIWLPFFYTVALIACALLILALTADALLLLFCKVSGERDIPQKLDLGEPNTFHIALITPRIPIRGGYIIDELPSSFLTSTERPPFLTPTERPPLFPTTVPGDSSPGSTNAPTATVPGASAPGSTPNHTATMSVTPLERGHYTLGRLLAFVNIIGLLERRIVIEKAGRQVDVYPAFSRLREKEQQIRSQQTLTTGTHKRQLSSSQTEFQDIREYVVGDDIRTVNWKATARVGRTMVNNYEDERSQHIFCIIDCGRSMHRTFRDLTLQDHAINASLLLSYTALRTEGDSMGIATYGPAGIGFLPPRPGEKQLKVIMQQLYDIKTEYGESDLEQMCLVLDRRVQRSSIIVLYTDYATTDTMERQLPFLRRIAMRHSLIVVNFIDNDLETLATNSVLSTRHNGKDTATQLIERSLATNSVLSTRRNGKDTATQLIERSLATDLVYQKQLIADKLQQYGIHCIMTHPHNLSFAVVKKYLELKSRR